MSTFKSFLLVFSILSFGAFLVGKLAVQSPNGGEVMRQMNMNNYVLVVLVLAIVSIGFALLNSAMDAEKVRRENEHSGSSENRKGS